MATQSSDAPGGAVGSPSSVPIPDPTLLTTQQLLREVENVRTLIHSEMDVLRERLSGMDKATQLLSLSVGRVPTDIDKEMAHLKVVSDERLQSIHLQFHERDLRFQRDTEDAKMAIEAAFRAEHELTKATLDAVDERFSSVAQQFLERDTRSERESRDNKVAVDAAFAAQKEAASEQNKSNTLAIDKSEKATAETLNKQADLFSSTTDGLASKIEDLKADMNRRFSVLELLVNTIVSGGAGQREAVVDQRAGRMTSLTAGSLSISAFMAVITIIALVVAYAAKP